MLYDRRPTQSRGVILKLFWAAASFIVALFVVTYIQPSRQMSVQYVQTSVPENAVERLSRAIQFETVSLPVDGNYDASAIEPFEQFHTYLEHSYPRVFQSLEVRKVNGLTLHLIWRGSESSAGHIVMLAHQDVVPIPEHEAEQWEFSPFSGAIEKGYVWGRGTLDNKHNILGMLEAVEQKLAAGFEPRHTIHFVFGHDEEVGGQNGALVVAKTLADQGLKIDAVYDEGLVIADGIVPGVAGKVALVGVTEKGYLTVRFIVTGDAGHSSMPPRDNTLQIMARLLRRLDRYPMPASLDGPAKMMFDFLGPEMTFPNRLVFANRWLFSPLILHQMESKTSSNALLRTTFAPTIIRGGQTENVLPSSASLVVNMRIHPRDSVESVMAFLRDNMSDLNVTIEFAGNMQSEPSPIADVDSQWFRVIQRSVGEVYPDASVAPGMMQALTDSRHFASLTPNIYRFQPIVMKENELHLFHGINERISIEGYHRLIGYYGRFIENLNFELD